MDAFGPFCSGIKVLRNMSSLLEHFLTRLAFLVHPLESRVDELKTVGQNLHEEVRKERVLLL